MNKKYSSDRLSDWFSMIYWHVEDGSVRATLNELEHYKEQLDSIIKEIIDSEIEGYRYE